MTTIALVATLWIAAATGQYWALHRMFPAQPPLPPRLGFTCPMCGQWCGYRHPSQRGPALRLHAEFECRARDRSAA